MINPIKNVPKVGAGSPLLSGILFACLWLAVGALLLSLLLRFSGMAESELPSFAWIAHGIAACAGGFVAGKRSGSKGWYHGGMLGLLYGVLVLLVGFLAADADLSSRSAFLLVLAAAAGATGGMLGINVKNR